MGTTAGRSRHGSILALAAALISATACSSGPPPTPPSPRPAPAAAYEEGLASWYGPGFAGRATASGEAFDPEELTAAHRTLPFGSRVRVVNLDNGAEVVVRINDRGPWVDGRIIDVSQGAARTLGMIQAGTARVRLILEGGDPAVN